jgi:2-C-methyl-D-erythritol 4-phosphate cytidylyltransferase
VLVHDACRPGTPFGDIDAVLDAAATHPAVTLAAPIRTPLVEVDEGQNPMALHPSNTFLQLLTPQGFSRQRFTELAAGRDVHPTEFKLVKGSPLNVRIGGAGDATLAKSMMSLLPKPKAKAPSNPFEEAQW